ncbi:TonB-dependent receptor [Sphingomonas sp. RB3P16]|uniref:TonB-dependent receptor n=1 Tax=Parasphingomonas frigoris TaxID=3096163 RepID=UPI002FC83D05
MFSPSDVAGFRVPAIRGDLTVNDAISRLLGATGLTATFTNGAVIIRGRSAVPAATDAANDQTDIVVTGTHIRHSEPSSPVISATRDEIERSGRSSLGEYIRDLPQNFGGGQNPGIAGGGVQGGNENVGSTSALNLRGLGPDATLTLINGHRVAYDGAIQGVDISAIPLAALDRIEIVADGSSALYGSDAVGGVANVLLRKDYQGLWTSARIAGTTDGGDFQQDYNLVTGGKWQGGGVMIAGDYNRSSTLFARDRSYTQTIDGSTSLIPAQQQVSGVLSGHQQLSSALTFDLDGQYSRRTSDMSFPSTTMSNARTNGALFQMRVASWSLTPTLKLQLPSDWRLELSGTIGRSQTNIASQNYVARAISSTTGGFYDNRLHAIELRGDGSLLALPGGNLGLAAGAGYRAFSLSAKSSITAAGSTTNLLNIDHPENVAFAYGELSLPIFGKANRTAFADFLQLSAAVRYERYEGLADVASPKLGLVYRPIPSTTVKGGWGKSFKAPTFYQRYKVYQAILLPAASLGGTGAIASSPVLYLAGGNPDLKPERSTNWNLSLAYEPPSIPALKLEANYFNIRYRNRVVNPITSVLGLFSNPLYSTLITISPTPAQLDALIAPTVGAFGLQNVTGKPYDPTTVYAVVDARSQNTAFQAIEGVDLSAQYRLDLSAGNRLLLNAAGSYLESDRRLLAGQPSTPTAGVIFMPPHWRARGGATLDSDTASLSAFINYIGGVDDQRALPFTHVGSFTSVDVAAHFALADTNGILRNIEFTIAATNLFNEKPALIRQSAVVDPTYDSTNYSAVGRALSITVAKRW